MHKNVKPIRDRNWNQLLPEVQAKITGLALLYPEWSSREISCYVADRCGFTVSDSTVYRILRQAGWSKPKEQKTFPASGEYHTRTKHPNQMWQTDATHLLVKRWGWYFLISVLDNFSRKILAWRLQTSLDADVFSEVVERACEATGMDRVPAPDRAKFLSDTGAAMISRPFGEYLEARGLGHILSPPTIPRRWGRSNGITVRARSR